MAKKGQQVTDSNQTPSTNNDTTENTTAPKGKKQKKTYN